MGTGWRTVGLAVAAVFVFLAPASVASPRAGQPDLVVSAITINGLGHNPYLVIAPDGSYRQFSISVTTRNIGSAKAPASRTRLELQHAPLHTGIGTLNLDIPPLARNEANTQTATVEVPKIPLGNMRVVAYADRPSLIPESNEANNIRTWGLIPVIARVWDVHTMRTEDQTLGIYSDIDHTDPHFKFRFARLDVPTGRFLYAAHGGARTSDLYDPKGCFGIGEATAYHSPWSSSSFLGFSFDLTKYVAVVKTSAEPPDIFQFTCGNGTGGPVRANWVDLMTGGSGPRSMFGWETELKGNDSKGAIIKLSWAWDFEAVLP